MAMRQRTDFRTLLTSQDNHHQPDDDAQAEKAENLGRRQVSDHPATFARSELIFWMVLAVSPCSRPRFISLWASITASIAASNVRSRPLMVTVAEVSSILILLALTVGFFSL